MIDTNLKLTEEQESDLLKYAFDRVESLKADNKERIEADRLSWDTYQNTRHDRVDLDSIY